MGRFEKVLAVLSGVKLTKVGLGDSGDRIGASEAVMAGSGCRLLNSKSMTISLFRMTYKRTAAATNLPRDMRGFLTRFRSILSNVSCKEMV